MTLKLRELVGAYRASAESVAALLPWFAQITPGLVINHDGSLLAAFEYEGLDFDSTTGDEHDAASQSLEIALGAFDERNILWSFMDKRRQVFVGNSDIANPTARFIEERWLAATDHGGLSSLRHVICVGYRTFSGASGFFDEIGAAMAGGQSLTQALGTFARQSLLMRAGIEKIDGKIIGSITAFEGQLDSFAQVLPRFRLRRIEANALLAELSNRINVATPRTRVLLGNDGPVYLSTQLPTDSLRRGDGGVLVFEGAQHQRLASMLSVKGYPGLLRNTHAEDLLMVPGDFTLVQVYRFLDREKAKTLVMRTEAHYRSQVKGPITQVVEKITGQESERVDLGQLVLADDAQAALVEITAEGVNFGYHTMAVLVIGRDPEDLQATRKAIASVLTNSGYGVVREVMHQVGAFMASIPGAADASVRSTLVSTRNLADLVTVRSIEPGPATNRFLTEQRKVESPSLCLFATPSGVPERFNLHVGDVGHFMVVGPSGGGKTTFINLLLAMWQRYEPCRVIVLDKDRSCYLTIKALGGSYISMTDQSGTVARMNPLRWMQTPSRWNDVSRWILGAMSAFGGSEITARQAQTVGNAIAMSAENGRKHVRLAEFKSILEGMDAELAARLGPWVQSGGAAGSNYGPIFDNDDDGFASQLGSGRNAIVGIDLGGLLKDERLAPSMLEYLFMSIDDMVDGSVPTFIYLEEAWYLLGNARFRAGYEDWIKTMRKRIAAVGLSTQSVEDVRRSGISSTLNDNIKTRIYLPNSQALASRDVYTGMLGLTDEHVQLIRSLVPKRHYLVWQDGRTRVLDAFLPPPVLALTRADRLARDTFDRCHSQAGENFLERYIKEMCHA